MARLGDAELCLNDFIEKACRACRIANLQNAEGCREPLLISAFTVAIFLILKLDQPFAGVTRSPARCVIPSPTSGKRARLA